MILALVWLPFVLLSASGAFALLVMGAPVPSQLESVPPSRMARLFLLVGTLGPALVLLVLVKHAVDSLDRLFVRAITEPAPEPEPAAVKGDRWMPAAQAPPIAEGLYTLISMIPEDKRELAKPLVHALFERMSDDEKAALVSMLTDDPDPRVQP